MASVPLSPINRLSACLVVSDLDASASWYREVLGFEVLQSLEIPEMSMRLAILGVDGFVPELVQSGDFEPGVRPGPPAYLNRQGVSQISLWVDDVDEVYQEAKARRATRRPKTWERWMNGSSRRCRRAFGPEHPLVDLIQGRMGPS